MRKKRWKKAAAVALTAAMTLNVPGGAVNSYAEEKVRTETEAQEEVKELSEEEESLKEEKSPEEEAFSEKEALEEEKLSEEEAPEERGSADKSESDKKEKNTESEKDDRRAPLASASNAQEKEEDTEEPFEEDLIYDLAEPESGEPEEIPAEERIPGEVTEEELAEEESAEEELAARELTLQAENGFVIDESTVYLESDEGMEEWCSGDNKPTREEYQKQITRVVLGEDVTYVGANAFSNYTKLEEVIFEGNSVKKIEFRAFDKCYSLKNITLPEGLEEINGFADCWALQSMEIPATVTKIGTGAFRNDSFAEMTIPGNVEEISSQAFQNCQWLKELSLSEGIVKIGSEAFTGCHALTEVNLPSTFDGTGQNQFKECSGIRKVIVADGAASVSPRMFFGCKNLREVVFSGEIGKLEVSAFRECPNLKTVIFNSEKPPVCKSYVFLNSPVENVYVPAGAENAYRNLSQIGSCVKASTAITFDAAGGSCNEKSRIVTPGEAIGELPDAVREGYRFTGWYMGKNRYTANSAVNRSITLKAGWLYIRELEDAVYDARQVIDGINRGIEEGSIVTDRELSEVEAGTKVVSSVTLKDVSFQIEKMDNIIQKLETEEQVAAYIQYVKDLTRELEEAVQSGTYIDFTVLDGRMEEARAVRKGILVTDKSSSEVEDGVRFVSPEAIKKLEDALEEAVKVRQNASSQKEAEDEAAKLEAAVGTFEKAVQTGTYKDSPSSEDKPSDKPSEDKPSEDKPSEDKPSEDKPSEDKPSEDKPSEDKPSEDKPSSGDKPSEDTPSGDKPSEGKPSGNRPSGGGSGGGSSSAGSSSTGTITINAGAVPLASGIAQSSVQVVSGEWKMDDLGRWSFCADGRTYQSEWAAVSRNLTDTSPGGQSGYDWFRFDSDGFMITGWYTDMDGNVYYLNQDPASVLGRMVTGWNQIDGVWYYFNMVSDGTQGRLLKNTETPDGFLVGEDGAWIVK